MDPKDKTPEPDKSPAAVPPPETVGPPAGLPDDLKPLPKPDDFKKLPPSAREPGGTAGAGVLKRAKKKKPAGNKKGCGCGSFVIFALLMVIGVLVGGTYWLMQPFKKANFVEQRAAQITVTEAPTEKTMYLGNSVVISAAQVAVEIGVFATSVELKGTFSEDVYIRAAKVHCAPGTVFQKDLDVLALEYINEGTVVGELKGKIVRQKATIATP